MKSLISVDLTGLERFNSELLGTLFGRGDSGDARRFVEVESGQLAQDCSDSLGGSQAGGEKKIERDFKRFMSIKPVFGEGFESKSNPGDMIWLNAGPKILTGMNKSDDYSSENPGGAVTIFRYEQKKNPDGRGMKYESLDFYLTGGRGGNRAQHVQRLNRISLSAQAFAGAIKAIAFNVGILRASFAFTAEKLLVRKKSPPAFVARHIASQAQGRAIFNPIGLATTSPIMEFGSRAYNVVSNKWVSGRISAAVEKRKAKAAIKLEKVLLGYTYDWNTGRVFNQQHEVINAEL